MNYGQSLQMSLLFYESQKSGKLGNNFIIPWRGDSCLDDGKSIGIDLSGGFFDAGDTVKFNFPMASSFSLIGWSLLEFGDGYSSVKEYDHALALFRWALNYMIKCHTSKYELVVQVGDGQVDHNYWGPVETQKLSRPVYTINAKNPGSDIAFEYAVCFAIATILWKTLDPAFSAVCYGHAVDLYDFANTYQGKYSDSVPQVQEYYKSWSGFQDEMVWASLWMYKLELFLENSTNSDIYKTHFFDNNAFMLTAKLTWGQNWDDKIYGALVLASQLFPNSLYSSRTENFLDFWRNTLTKTPAGLAWLDQWGSLRYNANTCFMSLLYYKFSKKVQYRDFAVSQINYMLGNNPTGFSYQIGYGKKYPLNPHHRNSHGAWAGQIETPVQNRHILYGALVGGPDAQDKYTDSRPDFTLNEVALDYNSGFTGSLAGLASLFPVAYAPLNISMKNPNDIEYELYTSTQYSSASFIDIRIIFMNKTCYPPRKCINPVFMYQSKTLKSPIQILSSNCNAVVNADNSISTTTGIYEGSEQTYQLEIQIRVTSDYKTDLSYNGLLNSLVLNKNILVRENGQNIYGVGTIPTPAPIIPSVSFVDVFKQMYSTIHSNYFSKTNGAPLHAIETPVVEAPDYGHETTSEAYSYWMLLEVYNAILTNKNDGVISAWAMMEKQIIPTQDLQPTNSSYKPITPATYTDELDTPEEYPTQMQPNIPVGTDPISSDLQTTYGADVVYGMHWLLDVDNIYGFGNKGDGVSSPSYFNTFQRGRMEGVWDTIPQPSWEVMKWGGVNGYLDLFTAPGPYSPQWKYTNAPDADARVVQAMHLLYKLKPSLTNSSLLQKTTKMGDFLRYSMFDKFFKPIGCQNKTMTNSTPYNNCHYLVSWYYAWGGSVSTQNAWAWKIGCSHVHFGYQNPMMSYALSSVMKPSSSTGASDWSKSLKRQIELYKWLQSSEGAIAGGATNSLNGRYESYPVGSSTFYGMIYQEAPVFNNPDSNLWIGWQVWSLQRVAEYYYYSADESVRGLLDKWIGWIVANSTFSSTNISYPISIAWTGQPNTFDPAKPDGLNANLHVKITQSGFDIGTASSLARVLMYYGGATKNTRMRDIASTILSFLWINQKDSLGVSVPSVQDFTQQHNNSHISSSFQGKMPSGALINKDSTFTSMRPFYKDLPESLTIRYHRFWEQVEFASACLDYEILFNNLIAPTPMPVLQPYYIYLSGDITITKFPLYGNLTVSLTKDFIEYIPIVKKNDEIRYIENSIETIVHINYNSIAPTPIPVVPTPTPSSVKPILTLQSQFWDGGFANTYTLTNPSSAPLANWKLSLSFAKDTVITAFWSVKQTTPTTFMGLDYNATIPAGQSITFGFQGTFVSNRTIDIIVS